VDNARVSGRRGEDSCETWRHGDRPIVLENGSLLVYVIRTGTTVRSCSFLRAAKEGIENVGSDLVRAGESLAPCDVIGVERG